MKSKFLLTFLAVICATCCAIGFAACFGNDDNEKTNKNDELEYELNADKMGYTVSGIGANTATNLIIPATYNNLPVTEINYSAFKACSIKTVTIPDSITVIGEYAFEDCKELSSINIPNSITEIRESAFQNCISLKNVTLPDGMNSIDRYAFSGCSSLTSINIPDSVTSIDFGVFMNCSSLESITIHNKITSILQHSFNGCTSLKSVTIPVSVKNIYNGAFNNCSSLQSITVDTDNINYKSENNCLLTKDGKTLIRGTNAGIIPENVTEINEGAFSECSSLKTVTITDGIKSIGQNAFAGCTSLEYNKYNDPILESEYTNVLYLGNSSNPYYALIKSEDNKVTNRKINDNTVLIADNAFYDCAELTEVTIPDKVKYIGKSAFQLCNALKSISIPKSIYSFGELAFNGCNDLTAINFSGNKNEWNTIIKNKQWDMSTGSYTVYCIDGNIAKQ